MSDNEKLHSKPDLPWWHAGNVTIGSKRKTKIKESNSWSSYWMDDDSYDYFYDRTPVQTKIRIDGQTKSNAQVDIARAGRLAAVRRAVSNFVRILTNDDEITVSFSSGEDSYSDDDDGNRSNYMGPDLRGVASWYVFRVRGSLAARVWKYHETMDDETTPGPNPSAGSAAPAAC